MCNATLLRCTTQQTSFSNRHPKWDSKRICRTQGTKKINLNDVFIYIKNAVLYFEKKIKNPQFFIWSNNFSDLDKIFDKKKFIFIENNSTAIDFYLFNFAKHFIVSPSSFHWWGAWLNTNKEKICVRPPDALNPSTNLNFWPDDWKKIS